MEVLHVAICEDLDAERKSLLQILEESQYPTAVSVFKSGEEFLKSFKAQQYDLILMDIFMDGLTGIDVITKVREKDEGVPVAFITTSMDFALESYRLNAIKYIEKPAKKEQVEEALAFAQYQQQSVKRLVLKANNTSFAYPLSQILYIEQKGRNLSVYLADGEIISAVKKVSEIEDQLPEDLFFRCHKSYVVNLKFIRGLDRELSTFEMVNGANVHIRRDSLVSAKKAFENYLFTGKEDISND